MKKEINEILKSHVDKHEYDVDIQSVWDAVEKEISPNKDRRKFLIIPVFLGLLCVGSLFYWNSSEVTVNRVSELTEERQEVNQNSSQNSNINIKQNDQSVLKAQGVDITEEQLPKKNKEVKNPNLNQNEKQIKSTTKESISSETLNFLKGQNTPSIINYTESNQFNKVRHSNLQSKTLIPNSIDVNPINDLTSVSDKRAMIASVLPLGRPIFSIENALNNQRELKLNNEAISIVKVTGPWSIGVWGGAAIVDYQFVAGSPVYKDALEVFETPVDAYKGGLVISYNLKSNWYLNTGISLTRMYDAVSWDGSYVVDIDGNVVPVSSIDGNGDPIYNYGTGIFFEEIEQTINGYNQQDFIDVPISLHFVQKDKTWSPEFFAGMAFNIYNKNDGHLLNSYLVPEVIDGDNYNAKVGMEYQIGAAINYRLTRKIGLSLGTKFSTRKVERQQAHLKYQIFELNSGLNYRF